MKAKWKMAKKPKASNEIENIYSENEVKQKKLEEK